MKRPLCRQGPQAELACGPLVALLADSAVVDLDINSYATHLHVVHSVAGKVETPQQVLGDVSALIVTIRPVSRLAGLR